MHYFGKKPSVYNQNQNVEHMQNFGLLNSTCGNSIKSLQVRQREIDFIKHTANTCILNVISRICWNNFFCHIHVCDQRKKTTCRKKERITDQKCSLQIILKARRMHLSNDIIHLLHLLGHQNTIIQSFNSNLSLIKQSNPHERCCNVYLRRPPIWPT